MFVELKCKNCGKIFQLEFDKESIQMEKCPKCQARIPMNVEERIRSVSDKYFYAKDNIGDCFDIIGLFDGKKDYVFNSDLKKLNELYNLLSPIMRKQMSNILDKLYLLIYHDLKDENIEALDGTYQLLSKLHEEKILKQRENFEKIFNDESEEK